jgi:hypothetical protein
MRYINHLVDARGDDKLGAYRTAAGLEGYGFYWELLEVVAKTKSDTAAYTLSHWAKLLQCHHHVVKKYLALLYAHGLVQLDITRELPEGYSQVTQELLGGVTSGYFVDKLRVKVPKLLKHNKKEENPELIEKQSLSYNKEINKVINNNCKIFDENEKILIPLADGSFYEVKEKQIKRWQLRFPNVDIMLELLKCIDWNENPANEEKRKSQKNIVTHIEGFFINSQNSNVLHFPKQQQVVSKAEKLKGEEFRRSFDESNNRAEAEGLKRLINAASDSESEQVKSLRRQLDAVLAKIGRG